MDELSSVGIPNRLGKYEVRGLVGEGGMGVVYRAYHADIDRLVAIKVLHRHLKNDEFVQRFRHEARAAARCVHRNIVGVYDFGLTDDLPYMVMEFVEGIDLHTMIKAEVSLPIRQSCDIVLQVLSALEYAHGHGVVHRDIKPANILLLGDGLVKVADFGVAKLDTSELTHVGYMIGTLSYMSPEARMGAAVDGRADLYAVGVVLMEMLCGMRPRDGRQPGEHQVGPQLSALPLGEGECHDFQRLIEQALADEPSARYQTAREFADALKAILAPNKVYQPSTEELAATVVATRQQILALEREVEGRVGQAPRARATHSSLALTGEESSLLSQALSSYLGPVSGFVVKEVSAHCESLEQLINGLAEKIPNRGEREQFRRTLRERGVNTVMSGTSAARPGNSSVSGAAAATGGAGSVVSVDKVEISPQQLDQLTQRLAAFLGPMAARLVKQVAQRASSVDDLERALAENIPDPDERRRFLDK